MDNSVSRFDSSVHQQELSWIKQRRQQAGLNTDEVADEDTIGLSLSGGGIRSATFNLGVLQALANHNQLKHIDYMSSVSGGGYIASALSWFKSRGVKQFPFGSRRADHNQFGGGVLSWFRAHASFLTPGNGINNMSLLAAIVTGSLINMLIIAPALVSVLYLAMLPFADIWPLNVLPINNGLTLAKYLGLFLLPVVLLLMISTALSTHSSLHKNRLTERLRHCVTFTLSYAILLIAIGAIPDIHQLFSLLTDMLVHTSIAIVLSGLTMVLLVRHLSAGSFLNAALGYVGLLIASLGILLLAYHLAFDWVYANSREVPEIAFVFIALSLLLAFSCNINLVSMHGYYRNRLRDAFLPYRVPKIDQKEYQQISSWADADICKIASLPITDAPYPIINCNVELPGSTVAKYRHRRGDCFIFSPLWTGADSTGGVLTSHYMNGEMDLASAAAISGAAVATNTKYTDSKPLNFLMAFFNLRLGCWLENPRFSSKNNKRTKPLWYFYMFRDMFGRGLNESQHFVHLSDGGHFENLGAYELVRRRCRIIIATDAGADPNFHFADLAQFTELIRVDFGAKLTLDTSEIVPAKSGMSAKGYSLGTITYADKSVAKFVYIKSCVVAGLSPDIVGYKHQFPAFPDQSTLDQFFDERQFEAYRELGFQLTHQLLSQQPNLFAPAAS